MPASPPWELRSGAVRGPEPLVEPLTPLIGRDVALAGLSSLLSEPGTRLVTLTGPPGIGKTRLALALARRWQATTGHAPHIVSLVAVQDAAYVLPAIAHRLGVPTDAGRYLVVQLAVALAGHPALIVLDNMEQVIAAAVDLVDLLRNTPQLTVLVTSRSPLRVRGEREWPVGPLPLPGGPLPGPLEVMAACPSVALLLERARAVDPAFDLTGENAATLAAICVRLEGIPLAIELAAARLNLLSPATLLERLERPLRILTGGARDLPARHNTLADAIAWSDGLLSGEERRLFHRLALFVDGWTLEAARAVWEVGGEAAEQAVIQGMSALLEQSLIRRESGADGTPRFRMLGMIREYAREQLLREPVVSRQAARRFAAYYLGFVEEVAARYHQVDQSLWRVRLEQELGNLVLALRWLIDHRAKDEALRFGTALEHFWLLHEHLSIGQSWLEEILAMPGGANPLLLARAQNALAALLRRLGDLDRARSLYQVTLAFYQKAGEAGAQARTLLDLGSLHLAGGDPAQGVAAVETALALARRLGDRRTEARALHSLGDAARLRGDDGAAVAAYRASLTIWRDLGEQEAIAAALRSQAPAVLRQEDRPRALALFGESLELSWALGETYGVALCLAGIAAALDGGWVSMAQSAQLLGAAAMQWAAIGGQGEPADLAEYERSIAVVRARLGEDAYSAAWHAGQRTTLVAAVELARRLLTRRLSRAAKSARRGRCVAPGGLSRREYEIVFHVALGQTNHEIADALFISEKTVETHISHALTKLGVRSRAQLAAWAVAQQGPDSAAIVQHPQR